MTVKQIMDIEIAGIQKTHSLGEIQKKKGIHSAPALDCLSISPESEKKALWVEMLKEMPDIRPHAIEATRAAPSSLELAKKIIETQIV